MEGETAGSREDPVLGEATQWCTVVDVLWSVGQLLHDLCRNEVLLAPVIDNEL